MNLPRIGIMKIAVVEVEVTGLLLILLKKLIINNGQIIVVSLFPKKHIFWKCGVTLVFEVFALSVPFDKVIFLLLLHLQKIIILKIIIHSSSKFSTNLTSLLFLSLLKKSNILHPSLFKLDLHVIPYAFLVFLCQFYEGICFMVEVWFFYAKLIVVYLRSPPDTFWNGHRILGVMELFLILLFIFFLSFLYLFLYLLLW